MYQCFNIEGIFLLLTTRYQARGKTGANRNKNVDISALRVNSMLAT